jgi:hypothetical protein
MIKRVCDKCGLEVEKLETLAREFRSENMEEVCHDCMEGADETLQSAKLFYSKLIDQRVKDYLGGKDNE